MNLEEFESQYQSAMDDVLNQMQSVVLLLACAETKTVEIGNSLQGIRQMTEAFLAKQRQLSAVNPALSISDLSISETVAEAELELRQVLLRSQV